MQVDTGTVSEAAQQPVLALVRDLIFSSRISGVARQLDVAVRTVRDPAMLKDIAGHLLIVDLNQPDALEAAAAWKAASVERHVVGFVSHVDSQTVCRAKEAGIDQVMARSRFVEVLPEILRNGE